MDDFKQRFEIIYKKYYALGVSQGFKPSKLAFSRFLGVLQGTMQNWEYKGALPNGKDLKTIHDKLGFSYDWLISGEGEMFDNATQTPAKISDKYADLELNAAKQKLAEQEKEISRLQNIILAEGLGNEKSVEDTAKAAGQE